MRMIARTVVLALCVAAPLAAQRADQLSAPTRQFVAYAEPALALTHVTLIDGTGAAPRRDMTVIIRDRSRSRPAAGTRRWTSPGTP